VCAHPRPTAGSVGRVGVGQAHIAVGRALQQPQVALCAAFVALAPPRAVAPHERQPLAVGREGERRPRRLVQAVGRAPIQRGDIRAKVRAIRLALAPRFEQHRATIGRPAPRAVARGKVGQPLYRARVQVQHEHIVVAVSIGGEGNLFAVGRPDGREVIRGMHGQPLRDAACDWRKPQIALPREGDLLAVGRRRREPRKPNRRLGSTAGQQTTAQTRQKERTNPHIGGIGSPPRARILPKPLP
jgi:hypothetical protein